MNKPERYLEAVKLFHKYGIAVLGAFVFGFDSEKKDIFRRTVRFAQRIKLDLAQFTVLTPLPGTPLRDELSKAQRIIDDDWSRYDFRAAVFAPLGMSAEELTTGKEWAWREFYSISSILKRAPSFIQWSRLLRYAVGNAGYRFFRSGLPKDGWGSRSGKDPQHQEVAS